MKVSEKNLENNKMSAEKTFKNTLKSSNQLIKEVSECSLFSTSTNLLMVVCGCTERKFFNANPIDLSIKFHITI